MGLDGRKPSTEAPPPGSRMIDEQLRCIDLRTWNQPVNCEDFTLVFCILESPGGEADVVDAC